VGVAVTGAIATNRTRHGEDCAYLAVVGDDAAAVNQTAAVVFDRGTSREAQEAVAGALLVAGTCAAVGARGHALAGYWPAPPPAPPPVVSSGRGGGGSAVAPSSSGVAVVTDGPAADGGDALDWLLSPPPATATAPPLSHVLLLPAPDGSTASLAAATLPRSTPVVILSGSFNPLHAGHERMATAAAAVLARTRGVPTVECLFELAAVNADKPTIATSEVRRRVAQFVAPPPPPPPAAAGDDSGSGTAPSGRRWPIAVTRCPRFIDKARLFPGAAFAIGYDTAVRLLDPVYYGGVDAMVDALLVLRGQGTRFIVAGRVEQGAAGGAFKTLDDLAPGIPPPLAPMFIPIPASDFRLDVSSTQLRAAAAAAAAAAATPAATH